MKSLIRNCNFDNEIYLLEELGRSLDMQAVWKTSSSPEGVKSLHRQLEGVHWYNSKNAKNIVATIEQKTPHYISVRYDYIKGEKVPFQAGYWANKKWIDIAIKHYCDVWGELPQADDELFPIHGDLSLDNFIFVDDGPIVLDWEYFAMDVAPLGFDGIYLIFEALWFEGKKQGPSRKILDHLASRVVSMHGRKCLDDIYLVNPLSQIIQFIESHSFLWGAQLKNYKEKIPILLFEEEVVKKIDKEVTTLVNQKINIPRDTNK